MAKAHVPDAPDATGAGAHPAPPELVTTIENVLTGAPGDGALPPIQARLSAYELITRTLARAEARIERLQLMGGALQVPGNLSGSALPGFDNSREFNMWMDPASARTALRRATPGSVHIVPLHATASVPITQESVARPAADQNAPGAGQAYRIVS